MTGSGGGITRTTTFTLNVISFVLTRVGSISLQSGEENVIPAVIDPSGTYAYFGAWSYPGPAKIVKIRLSDFSRFGSLTLLSSQIGTYETLLGEDELRAAVIDPSGQYAYFASSSANYGGAKIVKIRLADFTRVGSLMPSDQGASGSAVMDPNGQYAYFAIDGTSLSPGGKILKIRLSDFKHVGSVTLNSEEECLWCAVIDPTGTYAYFGTRTIPGKIVKVRLSDMTRVDALTLPVAESGLSSAVIDRTGQYAYFGCQRLDILSEPRVVKIRLSDFTRVGAVTLDSLEVYPSSAAIDPGGEYAYFGTNTIPGRVVKIRLSDFVREGSLTMNTGEGWMSCALIDPAGQYVYFGISISTSHHLITTPPQIVKIRPFSSEFDFSLSNSGGITVTQGGSGSNTVTLSLTAGTSRTVTLSASGLPGGATVSFSIPSGSPTFSCTCTISVSSSTLAGTYTVTVTGTGGGKARTTTFILTVNSPFGRAASALFVDTSYVLGFMMTGNIYDDSGTGFIYSHRSPPKILFSKADANRVLATGQPTWSGYTHLVTVGGRGANPTTRYYEDNGLAPLKWGGTATNAIILRGTEVVLNVPFSSLTSTNDYFTMQVIIDGTHKVVILWGITQYGTYASGLYFDGIYPNMTTLAQGWYIIRWQDLNGNGIPDYPAEFTIHASGN